MVYPTQRDLALFEALLEYRFLRRDQIQRLFFPGVSTSTVNRRLSRLAKAGYLDRERPPKPYGEGTSQYYFFLTRGSVEALAQAEMVEIDEGMQHLRRDQAVGRSFREHTLEINEVHVLLNLATRSQGWRLEDWTSDADLRAKRIKTEVPENLRLKGIPRRLPVSPDAFFVIERNGSRSCYFLELDRATEEKHRFQRKVIAFLVHKLSGQYTEIFQRQSLRVLTITTSPTRMKNLIAATREAQGGDLFWFSVQENLTVENILTGPVWHPAHLGNPQGLFDYQGET